MGAHLAQCVRSTHVVQTDGRMRAGIRRRRTHVSRQWVARRISCGITPGQVAKNGRANRPAHTHPPKGRRERHRPRGAPRSNRLDGPNSHYLVSPWVLKYLYCHQVITQTHPRGNGRVSEKVEI